MSLPSRREFLAGLAGGSLLTSSLPAREASFQGRIRKAAKFHMVTGEDLSIHAKFALLKDVGFDGTEIHTRLNLDRDEVQAASERTGLPVHGVLNSSSPDIAAAVDLAAFYGATSVLVVAGRVNEQTAYDANWTEWLARLKEAAPYAAEHHVRLLVENVWNNFLLSPLEMARFIDEIDHENVGAYFDIGNVIRFGYPDQWIRILGRRIGKLDIKDYSRDLQMNAGLKKGFDVQIGDGDAGWPAVRAALQEIEYTGWATAEVKGGDRARLAEIARRMDDVLALGSS